MSETDLAIKVINSLFDRIGIGGPARIEGVVKNSNGEPISEVIVGLGGIQNTTTISGKFIIDNVPIGQQTISLEYKGKIVNNVDQIYVKKGLHITLELTIPGHLLEKELPKEITQSSPSSIGVSNTPNLGATVAVQDNKPIPPSPKLSVSNNLPTNDNKSNNTCWCGCGESTKIGSRFRPGHDAKLHGQMRRANKDGTLNTFIDAHEHAVDIRSNLENLFGGEYGSKIQTN